MQEYDVTDVESFKAGLAARYDIKDVVPASWITPKSSYSRPFLVTFNSCSLPPHIEIPCETENLKIHEYKQKPMLYKLP